MKAVDWLKRRWSDVVVMALLVCAAAGTMLVLGRMEESRAAWRKAMFAATTTGGVDDRENSEAIRAFGFAYGGCVMSPPPAVDNECLEWAINRMTDERSESASPERVQAERATVLKLFDHLTVGAEPAT